MPLLLDFESRSTADLKRIGGRLYWEHGSTEALCCVAFDTDDGALFIWTPGDHEAATQIARRATAKNWAAHNASGFDRFAMARVFGVTRQDYVDTSELARTAGLPGALDALGSRWLDLPKDREASAYAKSLSRLSKAKGSAGRWLYDPDLARLIPYCVSDVEIMAEGWERLEPWLALEPDVVRVDRIVNERGIGFDVQLAPRLLEIDAELCERTLADVARVTGESREAVRAAASSPQQFTQRTGLPDAQKQTIDDALARGRLPPRALAFCRARRALASIARGKLEAGLARVSDDGRLRDSLRYYGAHTGRWSGRGVQLQNLPRPEKEFEDWTDDDICWLADHVLGGGSVDHAKYVDLLLRACLVPHAGHVLIARDFAAIEARALAFLAGDRVALEAFKAGRDLYRVAAMVIFGVTYEAVTKAQRQVGKVAELALGYQGGPGALERMARANGVELPASPSAAQIVESWRKGRPAIKRFWYAVEGAFTCAAQGESVALAGCTFEPWPSANGVAIFLPSGRPIVYNDVELSDEGLTYVGTKGREHIYGGKIVENLVQAYCRDLMADAMVAAESHQILPVALTVHDEVVCDVDERHATEAAAELSRIMQAVPAWARGMPINASGFEARRYRK